MKKIIRGWLGPCLFFLAGQVADTAQTNATVTTDQSDYPPGSTVNITGSGFAPGETVQLQVLNITAPNDVGNEHAPWTVTADTNGNFTTTWYVTADEANMTLQLTTTGLTSGLVAKTTFTDSVTINSVTVGSQVGTATYGTAGSVTYTVTVNYTHTSGSTTITPSIGTLPTGVTAVFSPATQTASTGTGLNTTFTLTLNTTTVVQAQIATSFTFTATGSGGGSASGNGTLTINKAPLTLTANALNKVYGTAQTTPVTGSTAFTPTGLKNSETVGTVTLTYGVGGLLATSAAGSTSTITPSAATGGTFTAANYTITYTAGTLTVTKAPLTLTANAQNKVYGTTQTTPVTGSTAFTPTGLKNGETVGTVTLTYGAGGLLATSVAGSTSTITPSAATGGTFTAANYTITYTAGTLTVNVAVLGITAASTNRIYGAANPTFTYTASGFVNGETTAVLSGSPSLTTTATTKSAVGGYTITAATGGLGAANYTFSFTNGTLTVNPLAVVLTGSRAYDGTTNAAFGILSVANAVNGDNVSVASGTGGLADKSAGAQSLTSFGNLVLGNNLAGNYTLAGGGGSVTIKQAVTSITVLSSLNPVGYKESVYFTATNLPADATGYVLFLTNSAAFSSNSLSSGGAISLTITNLPRGTNVITAQYAGDYNYLGSTNLLAGGQVATNHPPVVGNVTYTRSVNSIKISLSTLFTNVTDVDGDVISLAGVSTSTNGIIVTTNSSLMLYVNTNSVNDQFNYTVSDGFGGTATGTIVINYYPFPVVGQNASVTISGGTTALSFLGIPNFRYGIERSTNMTDWAVILITNAPANGAFHYTDNFSDLGTNVPATAFYRLEWNP